MGKVKKSKKAAVKVTRKPAGNTFLKGRISFPRQMVIAVLALLVLIVCGTIVMNKDSQDKAARIALKNPLNPYQVQSAAVSLPLLGYWKLNSIEYAEESIQTPENTEDYSVDFANNGFIQVSTDCAQATGSYSTDGSSINFAATLAGESTCTGESLGTRFIDALNQAEWYTFRDSALVITMKNGKGTIILEKQ